MRCPTALVTLLVTPLVTPLVTEAQGAASCKVGGADLAETSAAATPGPTE
jgi:hypothetical protein